MLPFLSNAFNDPSDPWYYVVGVIFLLLIFAAVGVYMYLVGRKNKSNADKVDSATEQDGVDKTETPEADEQAAENTDAIVEPQKKDKE